MADHKDGWDYEADNENEYYGTLDVVLGGAAEKAKDLINRIHQLTKKNASLREDLETAKGLLRDSKFISFEEWERRKAQEQTND